MRDQRLMHHAVIAVLMIEGHATLVAPEEMNLGPVDVMFEGVACQKLVDAFGRRTAGETEREGRGSNDNARREPERDPHRHILRIDGNIEDRLIHHDRCAIRSRFMILDENIQNHKT